MKKIYYEKVGRKYVPVSEHDSDLRSAFTEGHHLVYVKPGASTTMYNIDPDYAAMIAAGLVARDTISSIVIKSSELRFHIKNKPYTPEQKAAWDNLVEVFGDDVRLLSWPSAYEISMAAVKAMEQEAKSLLTNAAVKEAYDHFQLVCELAKDHSKK